MREIIVEVPEDVEERLKGINLQKALQEALLYEAKKKALLKFLDEMMKGAGQLSDKELVKLGREIKKGRFGELKNKGLI
jgi:hypothetical protein